jgi:Family of unknown function (DUF6441)/Bacteriophage HK97-gp10, putative tail-component
MLQISVAAEIQTAIAKLQTLAEAKQFRFSVAKALTQTAVEVQREVKKNMPSRFTLRRQWIVQGIRMEKATKDNLTATVYSKDAFMGRQEVGGTKTPKYDQHLAIPMRAVRRYKSGMINPADLPANLGQAQFTVKRGGKDAARRGAGGSVFKLVSNGRTFLCRRKNGKVELLYMLVPRAKVEKRLGLADDAVKVARARFSENLRDALEYAMRTAR